MQLYRKLQHDTINRIPIIHLLNVCKHSLCVCFYIFAVEDLIKCNYHNFFMKARKFKKKSIVF